MQLPKCDHCGEKYAHCVGAYEGNEGLRFACDECCAHGNEDGHCWPLSVEWCSYDDLKASGRAALEWSSPDEARDNETTAVKLLQAYVEEPTGWTAFTWEFEVEGFLAALGETTDG